MLFLMEFLNINLSKSFESILNDQDYVCKDSFLSNDELLKMKIDLLNFSFNEINYFEERNHKLEIKKFLYMFFICSNKFQINYNLIIFIIENFHKINKLFNNDCFQDIKNEKKPNNLLVKKIDLQSQSNIYPNSNNDKIYDFSFELFKSLLEVVFGKKIDEEDRSYNRKLIMKFFNSISSIISSLNENSMNILSQTICKKIDDKEIYDLILIYLPNILHSLDEKQKIKQDIINIFIEKKCFYEKMFFTYDDNSLPYKYNKIDNDIVKDNQNKTKYSKLEMNYPNNINLNNLSFKNIDFTNSMKESNINLNWRAIKSFLLANGEILNSIREFPNEISYLIEESFLKIKLNQNFEIQKALCTLITKLYMFVNEDKRIEIIDEIDNIIFQNKNYFIRRFSYIICEEFIKEYSFNLFINTKLYNQLLKLLRDPFCINNILEFIWKIYPFIEKNSELKKNLIVQIDYIKAMYSQQSFSLKYKIQQNQKENIILNIDKFIDKIESIYGYNYKKILEEDNLKYIKQSLILQENSEFCNKMIKPELNPNKINSSSGINLSLLSSSNKKKLSEDNNLKKQTKHLSAKIKNCFESNITLSSNPIKKKISSSKDMYNQNFQILKSQESNSSKTTPVVRYNTISTKFNNSISSSKLKK